MIGKVIIALELRNMRERFSDIEDFKRRALRLRLLYIPEDGEPEWSDPLPFKVIGMMMEMPLGEGK